MSPATNVRLGPKCPCSPPPTDENPKQHVPLDEYVANLKSMVRYLKSVDVPEHRIVLISPPPLCEAAWERECLAQGKRAAGAVSSDRAERGARSRAAPCFAAAGPGSPPSPFGLCSQPPESKQNERSGH